MEEEIWVPAGRTGRTGRIGRIGRNSRENIGLAWPLGLV
jgi:hypothetical protein